MPRFKFRGKTVLKGTSQSIFTKEGGPGRTGPKPHVFQSWKEGGESDRSDPESKKFGYLSEKSKGLSKRGKRSQMRRPFALNFRKGHVASFHYAAAGELLANN